MITYLRSRRETTYYSEMSYSPGGPVAAGVPPIRSAPPVKRSRLTVVLSVLWALVPLASLGFAAPFSFLYAAIRRRSWGFGASSALYGLAVSIELALPMGPDPDVFTFWDNVSFAIAVSVMGVGTAHAFLIRRRVFGLGANRANHTFDDALDAAMARQELRHRARALAERDPSLARELRVGRPDLPHHFDDGGLVDVNHAPLPVLAALPGMTPERVERIVRARGERGGFVSADELVVFAELPPDLAPEIADYAVFLP